METPQTRYISFGEIKENPATTSVILTVETVPYGLQVPVVDYNKATNTLTLNSREEFFTTTFKDKVE